MSLAINKINQNFYVKQNYLRFKQVKPKTKQIIAAGSSMAVLGLDMVSIQRTSNGIKPAFKKLVSQVKNYISPILSSNVNKICNWNYD